MKATGNTKLKSLMSGLLALSAPLAMLVGGPAHAEGYLVAETEIYEWSDEVANGSGLAEPAKQYITPQAEEVQLATPAVAGPGEAIASYGPFRVVSANRAEILGDIESNAPQQFRALLAAFPGIKQIDFIDCPGTVDDTANLAVARMIRSAGITTHVPAGGFVGSGGVELFLAGARRSADPQAEFAVHSWIDEDGMQADDFAMSDPVHQSYLAYYREMGMSAKKALAFYRMTNSAPFEEALYLKPRDIAAYIPLN